MKKLFLFLIFLGFSNLSFAEIEIEKKLKVECKDVFEEMYAQAKKVPVIKNVSIRKINSEQYQTEIIHYFDHPENLVNYVCIHQKTTNRDWIIVSKHILDK